VLSAKKIDRHEFCNREMSVNTLHLFIVFCLVVAVFTAFLREWLSPDLVALSAMGVLLVSGCLRRMKRSASSVTAHRL
jgi:hypothetical protein